MSANVGDNWFHQLFNLFHDFGNVFLCSFTTFFMILPLGVNNFQHISASYHWFSAVVEPISWLYHCFLSVSYLFQWKCTIVLHIFICMHICIYSMYRNKYMYIHTWFYRVHLCMLYYMYIRIYICVSKKDRKACVRFWPYFIRKTSKIFRQKIVAE